MNIEKIRKVFTLINKCSKNTFAATADLFHNVKSAIKPEIELNKAYEESRTGVLVIPYDIYYQDNKAWVKYNDLNYCSTEEMELNSFISCFKLKIKNEKYEQGEGK